MKRGSLVRIHGIDRSSEGFHGMLGTVIDLLELENSELISGRMCYAKVMLWNGNVRFISPASLEFLDEEHD